MDIRVLQEQVLTFVQQRAAQAGAEVTVQNAYIHLTEEVGELARQIVNKELRPQSFDAENMSEEAVDVVLMSLVVAAFCVDDLVPAIEAKMRALYGRIGAEYHG
jgi:NTP pyrophosphatase (non-canonical NTP hydrolase)